MSESQASSMENPILEGETRAIKEIDLTNLELPALQEALTDQINHGRVIHGSPRGDLTILHPATSHDGFKGTTTAVFATDQPLIALARGAAGNRIKLWTQQVIFGVDNLQQPFTPHGYAYVLPEQGFVQHPDDLAEYLSANSVKPLARITFNSQSVVPLFRTMEEIKHDINPETGMLATQQVRESDLTAAMLTLRNMLTLIGFVDYTTEMGSKEADRFFRMPIITKTLEPVLAQFSEVATSEQKVLGKEVYQQWYDAIYDLDGAQNVLFDNVFDACNSLLRKLSLR